MPTADPWEAKHRTYRSAFRSNAPQRVLAMSGPDPTSSNFERSGALILGPGSYE